MGNVDVETVVEGKYTIKPRWVKGQSGNPGGRPNLEKRPRGDTFTALCRRYLSEPANQHDTRTRMCLLVEALYNQALGGSVRAAMVILDRVDPIEKAGNIGNTARIIVNMIAERVGITLPESATALTPIDVTVGDSAMAQPIDVTPISDSANG